jgi:hypothetical protein
VYLPQQDADGQLRTATPTMTVSREFFRHTHDFAGADRHLKGGRLDALHACEQPVAMPVEQELERAWSEGSHLGLAQMLDRLRWMANAY